MTLGSWSCTALCPGQVASEISGISLHITAVPSFRCPWIGRPRASRLWCCLIYSEAVREVPALILPPSGHWGLADNDSNDFQYSVGECAGLVGTGGCEQLLAALPIPRRKEVATQNAWALLGETQAKGSRDKGQIPTVLLGQDWDPTAPSLPVAKQRAFISKLPVQEAVTHSAVCVDMWQ